jgi:hypothetical protein
MAPLNVGPCPKQMGRDFNAVLGSRMGPKLLIFYGRSIFDFEKVYSGCMGWVYAPPLPWLPPQRYAKIRSFKHIFWRF